MSLGLFPSFKSSKISFLIESFIPLRFLFSRDTSFLFLFLRIFFGLGLKSYFSIKDYTIQEFFDHFSIFGAYLGFGFLSFSGEY